MTKIIGTKPKWLLLSVAVLAGVATSAILPSAATAASFPRAGSASAAVAVPESGGGDGCNPGRANNYLTYYWIGATSQNIINGTPVGGVYANIRTYSPFVAGPNQGAPSNDSVSEWVMLDSGTPVSSDQWAQTEASQVPGGTTDPSGQVAQVTNAHVWPTAGSGGWGNFDGYTLYASLPTSAPENFIGIAPNGTGGNNSWRTWDKACTK